MLIQHIYVEAHQNMAEAFHECPDCIVRDERLILHHIVRAL